jgi:hypothetical protein
MAAIGSLQTYPIDQAMMGLIYALPCLSPPIRAALAAVTNATACCQGEVAVYAVANEDLGFANVGDTAQAGDAVRP